MAVKMYMVSHWQCPIKGKGHLWGRGGKIGKATNGSSLHKEWSYSRIWAMKGLFPLLIV